MVAHGVAEQLKIQTRIYTSIAHDDVAACMQGAALVIKSLTARQLMTCWGSCCITVLCRCMCQICYHVPPYGMAATAWLVWLPPRVTLRWRCQRCRNSQCTIAIGPAALVPSRYLTALLNKVSKSLRLEEKFVQTVPVRLVVPLTACTARCGTSEEQSFNFYSEEHSGLCAGGPQLPPLCSPRGKCCG
jgi:hypothetical protein